MKKKIFFLAESVVDLRFIYNELNNHFDLKWVFYSKKLKKEFLCLGYRPEDLIYLRSNFFTSLVKKILSFIISKKVDFQKEIQKNIVEIDKKFNPDMWITDTGNILSSIKLKSIKATFKHSIPYKKYFLAKNIFDYDYVFIPGNYHLNRIKKYYNKNHKELEKKLITTISPKILPYLILKNEINDKKKYYNKLNLNHKKKSVVLATTHNSFNYNRILPENFGPEFRALEEMCEIITKKFDYNFIIKPHHYHFKKFEDSEFSKLLKFDNVKIFKPKNEFDSLDSEMVLFNSDIIITDTSGVGTTCCFLDKKIIYLEPDTQNWEDSDIEKDLRPGFILQHINDLSSSLRKYKDIPNLFSKERLEFRNKIFQFQSSEDLNKIAGVIDKIL